MPANVRRQISHDIRHELSTIMLLASMLSSAADIGPESRDRARHILGETRWLDRLHRAYDESLSADEEPGLPVPAPIRLDAFAAEVVETTRLSTFTRINFFAKEAWAHVDQLAFWRALRNLVGNAVRAAGSDGAVEVSVYHLAGWAVAQVDDDGPGFGAIPAGTASLGMGIVQDLAAAWGGELEIRRGVLGGCCVRLRLPAALPPGEPVPGVGA
jgi:signal transduction histidine kinase